jgi:Domain of unknown function (DUF1707)
VAYGPGQAYPPQPPVPEGFGAVNPAWLAASADRERAVGVLRAGFTEGRLSQEELDDRVARAYAARTYGQLWELTADLPSGALPYPPSPHGQGALMPQDTAPAHWRPAAALIITALVIFTLAALITAVITAHTQTVIYPGFQHANLTPFIQRVGAGAPDISHAFPKSVP